MFARQAVACALPVSSLMRATARISGQTASRVRCEDVFELQDRVTTSVVGIIAPRVQQAEIERVRSKPAGKFEAYDLLLRALHPDANPGRNRSESGCAFAKASRGTRS